MSRLSRQSSFMLMCGALLLCCAGCPSFYYDQADKSAAHYIRQGQAEALGREEPFTIRTPENTLRRRLLLDQNLPRSGPASLGAREIPEPEHWPDHAKPKGDIPDPPKIVSIPAAGPVRLTLNDALMVAARNSRPYQTRKEEVFRAALDLDLESYEFRSTFLGTLETVFINDLRPVDQRIRGLDNTSTFGWEQKLKTGAVFTANLAIDLVKLLSLDRTSAFGILADATMTIPLLKGAGEHIVAEPLTQAQRNVVYRLWELERYKKQLAVQIAGDYLDVLRRLDEIDNQAANYRNLILQTRRARAMAREGRLPEIQVDQAYQNELRARDRWVVAREQYAQRLDAFKVSLGLPTDADIVLDRDDLQALARAVMANLAEAGEGDDVPSTQPRPTTAPADHVEIAPPSVADGGPMEIPPTSAVQIALKQRLDMRVALGEVYDAQRKIIVAANALQAGLTITGSARIGDGRTIYTTGQDNVKFRPERGLYQWGILLDLPLDRTVEQDLYRETFIDFHQSVRDAQQLEDEIKLEVRDALRNLIQFRESFRIQNKAVRLAEQRVKSTQLFLQLGLQGTQIRDVLEAQEALVSAQNARTAALVNYRLAELQLQRDMGVLSIGNDGLWREWNPPDGPAVK